MLSTLITSAARRKLLTHFLTHPEERFYQKQLMRDLGLSSSLVQRELSKLEEIGLLTSTREANARYFQIDTTFPLYPELKSIVYKTTGLADVLRASLADIGDVEAAFVYGSVAKNVEEVGSDVDLLVIGDVELDVLDDVVGSAEAMIGREINTATYSRREWQSRVERDQAFAKDVVDGPKIFLIGSEDGLRSAD